MSRLLKLLFVYSLFAASVIAAVPQTINYQGHLADSGSVPVNAALDMSFTIYNAATNGANLWTEDQTVQVNNGIYAVALGAINPIDPAIIDGDLWLGVKVGSDAEMTPRQKLNSVPFALSAAVADDLATVLPQSKVADLITNLASLQNQIKSLNQIPVADAGMDLVVDPGDLVNLDGSGTTDFDVQQSLSYSWSITDKPFGSTTFLNDPSLVSPSFTADIAGNYTLTLAVDDTIDNHSDTVIVFALPAQSTRFRDLGNGTVRDNLSGLIWLKEARCKTVDIDIYDKDTFVSNEYFEGECGLEDGSNMGVWRFPTIAEWEAFADLSFSSPALSNAQGDAQWSEGDAFVNVGAGVRYHTSESVFSGTLQNTFNLSTGSASGQTLSPTSTVWPIRSGR